MSTSEAKRTRTRRGLPDQRPVEDRRIEVISTRRLRGLEGAREFAYLPDDARVRQAVVEVLLGISAPTVWRWAKTGKIPTPRRDGHVVSWRAGDIRQLLSNGVGADA